MYSYFHLDKIKKREKFSKLKQHNYREVPIPNVDPTRSNLNKEFILQTVEWGKILERRINNGLKKGLYSRKIRKDAILGFEAVASLPYGAKEKVDVVAWAETTVEWVKKTFNVASDEDNVVSAVMHMDETSPHIHFIILPFIGEGKLNGTYFMENKRKLTELQDGYANAVKKHGLKRGLKKSRAQHQDIAKFYTELNYALEQELPAPERKESVEEYYERANIVFKEVQLQRFQEQKKAERAIVEADTMSNNAAQEWQRQILEIDKLREQAEFEIEKKKKIAEKEIKQKIEIAEMEAQRISYDLRKIYTKIYNKYLESGEQEFEKLLRDINRHVNYIKALREYPEQEFSEQTKCNMELIYKHYVNNVIKKNKENKSLGQAKNKENMDR